MKPKYKRIGLALRASDPASLRRLVRTMRAQDGCLRATAAALGMHEQTLYSIAKDTPRVRRILAKEGIGRAGVRAYNLSRR